MVSTKKNLVESYTAIDYYTDMKKYVDSFFLFEFLLMMMKARRFEKTKNVNVLFCLQSSSKVIIFETLLALLNIPSMSRFETDRIFLKNNFNI